MVVGARPFNTPLPRERQAGARHLRCALSAAAEPPVYRSMAAWLACCMLLRPRM
jgi:hypothetical protein